MSLSRRRRVSVISKRRVAGNISRYNRQEHETTPGHIARNELDTHADTSCAGSNWALMELTGEICEVAPFLDSYDPVTKVPVARCGTVWTNPDSGEETLLVHDQMLWFGSALPHALVNPNQVRAYGLEVRDNPFDRANEIGIQHDEFFIPFDTKGTLIYFETRVPTQEELWGKLPVALLSADEWDPQKDMVHPGNSNAERAAMRAIHSIGTVGTESRSHDRYVERYGEVETVLGDLSSTYNEQDFCKRLISKVQVATTYQDQQATCAAVGTDRHSKVGPEELSRKWGVGLQTAKDTMKATTQAGIRTAVHPMNKRLRVDHLHLHRKRLHGNWFCDTVMSKVKSLLGNTCANIYTQGKFTRVVPMTRRHEAGESFVTFTDDVGIPESLTTDGAGEFTGKNTQFVREARKLRTKLYTTEQGRKNQNHPAEREIGILSTRWKSRMAKKRVPKRLWDFGLIYESDILCRMARGSNRRTGYEEVFGDTPDISEWLDFEFYDMVWWLDRPNKPDVSDPVRRLARWLGVSHRVGSDLCYWLITESGQLISKTSVEHVTRDDHLQPDLKHDIDAFDEALTARLADANFQLQHDAQFQGLYLDDIPNTHDEHLGIRREEDLTTPTDEDYDDMLIPDRPEADNKEAIDNYLNAELIMDLGTNSERRGRVVKRSRGPTGEPIGRSHANPLFDTREYDVEFMDGTTERYQANIIAENMYAQVDSEGHQFSILDEITDHKKDNTAIPISDGTIRGANGQEKPKKTTRGWSLLVQWKDGLMEWVRLNELKESNPIEVAECAVANRIAEEPAFKWWVPHVIRRRNRIISKVKGRYWRMTHKYGIKLPHSVEEALQIDEETGTDFWRKAMNKEMAKVKVAWKTKEGYTPEQARRGEVPDLVGYQEIGCHIVFDNKMSFERKARFVAGGHTTDAPTSMTYSSVVSRESVRLGFMIAALNGLDICACDLQNAYLNAPCREKIWFEAGLKCGEDKGMICVVTRALYGLKSAGASWRNTLSKLLTDLRYYPSKADPDVWLRTAAKPDGWRYYEMLLVYVDDIMSLSHKARDSIAEITNYYTEKEGSVKEPDLGANVSKHQLPDGRVAWSTSPRSYVKNALSVVERLFIEDGEGYTLKSSVKNPFPSGYRPELDVTDVLNDKLALRYLQLIGILRWAIELGRIDINLEVSLLSQYQANPRIGHLEALYHVFSYLKNHQDMGKLVYDAGEPVIDENVFNNKADWTDFYGQVEEELPPNMPEPLGKAVSISAFVDANHAGNVVTRRSHTGIIIFVQNAPIIWYSKKQNTVESATFGSELVALRICKELLVGLRYKLRMFGVAVDGPSNVFCDNRGVVMNTSIPESTLTKKHNSINYHVVREAVAAGILRVGKEDGQTNLADLLTKTMTGKKRWDLCWHFMW